MASTSFSADAPRLAKGRFVVAGRLAKGPLSSTFRVQDTVAVSVRALALLQPDLVGTSAAERFDLARQVWSNVEHPHVVQVLDLGEARNVPFVVLEDLGGGTLGDWLGRNGAVLSRTAGMIGIQLVDALTAIHGGGVVHQQVTPATTWLAGGVVKLGDLEVACEQGTRTAQLGTSMFRPRDEGPVADPRTDLYGVGATMWALLRGELPRSTPDADALAGVHPEMLKVIRRCLARASDRYASAELLAEDLLEALGRIPEDQEEPALVGGATMVTVDRSSPELAAAADTLVDPLHPLFRGEEKEEDRPAWLESAPPPESADPMLSFRQTPLPEAVRPAPPPAPAPPPKELPPNTDPWKNERAAKANTPQPAEKPPPKPKEPAPAAKPVTKSEEVDEPSRGGMWLRLLLVPLLGGIALVLVLVLAVVVTVGTGVVGLHDGEDDTLRSRMALYRAIDDQRRVVDQLGGVGADRGLLEQDFIKYMEQRDEPAKLEAALAFVADTDTEAARVIPDGSASPDDAAAQDTVRKLRVAKQGLDDAVAGWHAAAQSTTGRIALTLGLGREPDR